MKILLVEDEARVAEVTLRGLTAEGHNVELAVNAAEAWLAAMGAGIDIILLDIMLPDETGLTLCHRLRGSGVATPILMLTALDAVLDRVDGLRSGADDYLVKPYAFDELLARIEAIVRRRTRSGFEPQDPVLVHGDLKFDRDAMQAWCREARLALTPKELGILVLLMERPGAVVSRERMLREVWDTTVDPMTNIVDVYLGRLRRKLLESGCQPIETVRGFGYRLVD